ncbi:MAG: hypothetical protein ACYSUV_19760 [Planctomycetota bacterium]|jgi:hypothetical protein
MALTLELIVGSDLTLNRDNLTIVRKFRVKGTLPYTTGGDCFDTVASQVMYEIQTGGTDPNGYAYGPTYDTPMGLLYWNSIQLHESYYAQAYDIGVTYSPHEKKTGTYLVRVEHAAGTAKATAGERIAGYPTADAVDNKGVIWNGQEVVGVDVPFNQSRIVISYRHPEAFLNHDYLRAVGRLVGHPNDDTFLGYAPGEIAYTGGNATESETEASAEYTFEVSRNVTNIEVGGITIADKKGFDIISPVYKWDTEDDAGGTTKAIRPIDYIEIIRPRGREWMNYVSVFGWGGPAT